MYQILISLQAVENKTLTESTEYGMNEIADADFDADALAKHKSRLAREKNRMSLSMPKPGGGPRKSDVPAAARAARAAAAAIAAQNTRSVRRGRRRAHTDAAAPRCYHR